MDRSSFQPAIDRMRARLAQVKSIVDGIEDDNLHGAGLTFVRNTGRWIDSWATTSVDRVLASTWPLSKWVDQGKEIAGSMSDSYLKDLGDISGWFHGLELSVAGAVDSAVSAYADQVQKLADKVKELHAQRTELWHLQQALEPIREKLPADVRTALWGKGVKADSLSLDALDKILAKAQQSVSYLRTGKATLQNGDRGAEVVAVDQAGLGSLGFVQVIVLGVVAVAITTAIALYAHYNAEIALGEQALEEHKLELVAKDPSAAARIHQLELDEAALAKAKGENQQPGPFDSLLTGLKWAGVAVGLGGVVWVGKIIYDATQGHKARAAA